jgi:glycosyltransferase involved in cell wall biosynthesis
MMNRGIALLLPCYDAAEFLPNIIAEARAQTVPFAEIICYDDASRDNTREVAGRLGVRMLSGRRNRGAAFARNELLAATQCPWVHFHDADDSIDPAFVEKMSAGIRLPTDCVVCDVRLRSSKPNTPEQIVRFEHLTGADDFTAYFLTKYVRTIAMVFPTELLRKIGGYNQYLRLSEDDHLQARVAAAGATYRYIPEALATVNQNMTSLTHRTDEPLQYRYYIWALHLLYRQLPSRYRPLIGHKLLYQTWCSFFSGSAQGHEAAFRLAKLCGIRHLRGARLVERVIGWLFGPGASVRVRLVRTKMLGGLSVRETSTPNGSISGLQA